MFNALRWIVRAGAPWRMLQSTCENGPRTGYDGYKRKRGSKVHMAVDTLGQLLAVPNTLQRHAISRKRLSPTDFAILVKPQSLAITAVKLMTRLNPSLTTNAAAALRH